MYDTLVLASGGARGIVALGALDALVRRRYLVLGTIGTFAGSSIGAVLATGLALGRTPQHMLEAVQRHAMKTDFAPSNFGLDGGRGLRQWIADVLGTSRITFAQLHAQTGKTVVVCVCNLDRRRAEHWSRDTHPHVDVLDALRISCSVPGMFAAVRVHGEMFVDGAVADPFPIPARARRCFGIRFDRTGIGGRGPIVSLTDFIAALVDSNKRSAATAGIPCLVLETHGVDPLDFSMPAARLRSWFCLGRRQAAAFVKKNV